MRYQRSTLLSRLLLPLMEQAVIPLKIGGAHA